MEPTFVQDGLNTVIKNVDNNVAFLPPKQGDYGILFHKALSALNNKISKYILQQLINRLPDNLTLFESI